MSYFLELSKKVKGWIAMSFADERVRQLPIKLLVVEILTIIRSLYRYHVRK